MLGTLSRSAAAALVPPRRRTDLLIGAALLVPYLAVLLMDLSVPQPTDHIHYMIAARDFPSRSPSPLIEHQYLRIGLTAPTAVLIKLFGFSEVAYYTFPIAMALLLFASVYAIGTMMFGRLVGALSAAALGAVGVILVAGTELLPDLPATALFTSVVAAAIALRQGRLGRHRLWLAVIGVLLGWSYLTREFIVFVWPLVPVLLWRRIGRWEWLWVLVPVALTGAGEVALNAHLYGDPLARLHASAGLGDLPSRPSVAVTFRHLPRWVYLWRLPQQLSRQASGPALLLLLALTLGTGAVALARLVRDRRAAGRDMPGGGAAEAGPVPSGGRDGGRSAGDGSGGVRRAGVFALWILLLWVPLTLLGGLLDPARPKLRLQLIRYWYPVFPAFVLGGIATLWLLARAVRIPGAGRSVPLLARARAAVAPAVVTGAALVIAGLAVFGRPGAPGWAGSPRVSSDALPEFRSWLTRSPRPAAAPGTTLWADARLFHILPIYFAPPAGRRIWRGRLRPLLDSGQPAAGDYVVVFSVGSDACPRCGSAARAVLPAIPPSWRPVMTSRDHLLRVWRVA